jgi:hypothetical protein
MHFNPVKAGLQRQPRGVLIGRDDAGQFFDG